MDDKPKDKDVEIGGGGVGDASRAQHETRPSAGPHARKDLTNPDATPGAGSLPDENGKGDADGGTG